jgi:UDP-N-acetylglucosamine/UDP-N-acetylgalactosamine diphosphorylase
MDVAFLARTAEKAGALPFHVARKKVAYVDASGHRVEPQEPNAIKFERFVFDLLPWAEGAMVVEVEPEEHFSPLKNASGAAADTPELVQSQMAALHRRWLREAGVGVSDDIPVEISPLFALDGAEVAGKVHTGIQLAGPTYLE